MKRVSEIAMSFDQDLIQDLIDTPSTNRKQLTIACALLSDVITNKLPPRQKEIITLYYYQNLNRKEIASLLHLEYSVVCRTLRRAKINIKKEMQFCFSYLISAQED